MHLNIKIFCPFLADNVRDRRNELKLSSVPFPELTPISNSSRVTERKRSSVIIDNLTRPLPSAPRHGNNECLSTCSGSQTRLSPLEIVEKFLVLLGNILHYKFHTASDYIQLCTALRAEFK